MFWKFKKKPRSAYRLIVADPKTIEVHFRFSDKFYGEIYKIKRMTNKNGVLEMDVDFVRRAHREAQRHLKKMEDLKEAVETVKVGG